MDAQTVRVFVPKERAPGENRVAATPETVRKMRKKNLVVRVERGAGEAAHFPDADYEAAGAELVPSPASPDGASVVLQVAPPDAESVDALAENTLLIAYLNPFQAKALIDKLVARKVTTFAMELVPRVTRAQSMDALSSQASIAGYKAVLEAAARLDKYFPLLMTAAGTVKPARVVVMGAGVAGLQAIATARRLGAVVEVSDIRPEVKEQVESLGGKFIELPMQESGAGEGGYAKEMSEDFLKRQQQILADHVAAADVVITTAQIPGKQAPRLVDRATLEKMRPGAVVVDLAASSGGNVEGSKPDEEVSVGGVRVLGMSNLPAEMPFDASLLYARNVWALLELMLDKEGGLNVDLEDEVLKGAVLTHAGEIASERVKKTHMEGAA
ncbi:MAG TPA: Re/Si-specific NAD(P)(+) transhydrogenase subunit alpha [Myxococcales bacterium LLY-WYZ-16_1]|nr:Re/Si-specific NAD(P)(+) transhydrogenase subunit alpha [Myxococcales bacterium LLY-WYZ-16_1]